MEPRKGLADTALKTADSGYMTRKLVDVSQDVNCNLEDCGTINGIWVTALMDAGEVVVPLKNRIVGRFCAQDVKVRGIREFIIKANEYITNELAEKVGKHGVEKIMIRSPLTCEAEYGICINCYGKKPGFK